MGQPRGLTETPVPFPSITHYAFRIPHLHFNIQYIPDGDPPFIRQYHAAR